MIQLWARICRRYRNISDPFSHAFLKKDPFCHAFLKKIIYFQCVISCQSVSLSHCDGASQVEHDIIILRVPPNANESRSTYSLLWTSFFFKSLIKNPKQMQRLHEEVLLSVTATALRAPLVPRSMKPRNIMYWAQFLLIPFACWFSFSISFWIPFPRFQLICARTPSSWETKRMQIGILASWSSCWFSNCQKVAFRILSSRSSCVTGSKHISAPSTSTKPMLKCISQAIRATWEFKENLNIDENNIYMHLNLLYLKKIQNAGPNCLKRGARTSGISIRFSNVLSCVPIFFNILLHLAHVWMLHVLSMALKALACFMVFYADSPKRNRSTANCLGQMPTGQQSRSLMINAKAKTRVKTYESILHIMSSLTTQDIWISYMW